MDTDKSTHLGSAINGLHNIAKRDSLPTWAEELLKDLDYMIWDMISDLNK